MPTAFITGATAGIGAEFTRRLAADGFDLVLVARDEQRLKRQAAELTAGGRSVETLTADLSTDAGIEACEERLADGTRPVTLLINNAGFGLGGGFGGTRIEDERAMLRVHCEAVLRLTNAVVPVMTTQRKGAVINVASVAAFFVRGTYGASKAWEVSFSEGANAELAGTGIHVMALCPGFTHTEFHDRAKLDMSGIPRPMWLTAKKVVDGALADLRHRRTVSIPGAQWKLIVTAGRLLPRWAYESIAARTRRVYQSSPR